MKRGEELKFTSAVPNPASGCSCEIYAASAREVELQRPQDCFILTPDTLHRSENEISEQSKCEWRFCAPERSSFQFDSHAVIVTKQTQAWGPKV
ncbi:uncharacterized [Tachysurus ichikawai]